MLGGWGSKLEVIQRSQSSYKGLGLVLTLFDPRCHGSHVVGLKGCHRGGERCRLFGSLSRHGLI